MPTRAIRRHHGYWDFGKSREPSIHRIHAYPAKFPAFITSKAVQRARRSGLHVRTVADIFCGCGTTAYESRKLGLEFWGCDINPVAVLIARVKSNAYDTKRLGTLFRKIVGQFKKTNSESVSLEDLPPRLRYWYHDSDAQELKTLLSAIRANTTEGKYRDFFLCAFSNILKAVSKWLTKSIKPQIDPLKQRVSVLRSFEEQVNLMIKAIEDNPIDAHPVRTIRRDNVLTANIPKSFADIVVTSPPYVTSYEYADLHQLSSLWLGYAADYRDLREGAIGSVHRFEEVPENTNLNAIGNGIVSNLTKVGSSKAKATARYFSDMRTIASRCRTILRPGGMVFFVIGDTEYKGVKVSNSAYLRSCLREEGFVGIKMEKRKITGKNLSPYRTDDGKFSSNPHDKKIYAEEFVLTGRKPDHE